LGYITELRFFVKEVMELFDLTTTWAGIFCLIVFIVGYSIIALEHNFSINKAKPALFIGTLMFITIAVYLKINNLDEHHLHKAIEETIAEVSNIFFFLFVAMIFIQTMIERNVFEFIKAKIISKNLSYKQIFWLTGTMAFCLSPVADNLTTALVLSTVIITIEQNNKPFLVASAINITVAANAGGAFCPFGDITTLMAWTAGKGEFIDFFGLFPASLTNWVVTAFLLSLYLPSGRPAKNNDIANSEIKIKKGGIKIVVLGISTIFISVVLHQMIHLPVVWGMLFGLSILQLYTYQLKIKRKEFVCVFSSIAKIEHDTLIFFIGILSAVSALHFIGYLNQAVTVYQIFPATLVNVGVGFISAVIDNVPVMSAVLKANPEMAKNQWMLLTLTAGVGGSLISFGSAAGVGVMGKMRGIYTFSAHLRYAWTVLVGYAASIGVWFVQFEMIG